MAKKPKKKAKRLAKPVAKKAKASKAKRPAKGKKPKVAFSWVSLMSELKGPLGAVTAKWAQLMDEEDKAVEVADAAALKKASTALRKKNGYLLGAMLGDTEKPIAAMAAQWDTRADAIEHSLAAGGRAWRKSSPQLQAAMLCWAAGRGRINLLTALLKAGADPNASWTLDLPGVDFYGDEQRALVAFATDAGLESGRRGTVKVKPLCFAVRNNQLEACRLLLEAGADPNSDVGTGLPILDAVGHGFAAIVQLLIKHGARTEVGDDERPLLHMAGSSCHPQVTRVLLKSGLNPNQLDQEGGTPLMAAAWRGDAESVKLLLAAGAAVDPPDRTADSFRDPMLKAACARGALKTTTPLVAASSLGHVEVVRELLKYKPDLSRANSENQTALDAARKNQHKEIEQMLRDAGADAGPATAADLLLAANDGDVRRIRAALDAGILIDTMIGGRSHVPAAALEMAEAMKKGGLKTAMAFALQANLAAREKPEPSEKDALPPKLWGMTALMIATKEGHLDAVRLLIERGADVMARSSGPPMGQPPLYFATYYEHIAVMKVLLDAGADPSSTGTVGSGVPIATPLFAAVEKGCLEAVRLLLDRGARTDLKSFDIFGIMTPLQLAVRYKHSEIVQILKQVSEK